MKKIGVRALLFAMVFMMGFMAATAESYCVDTYYDDYDYEGTAYYEPCTQYIVNCESWVSLREAPYSCANRILKVPFGAKVEVGDAYDGGFYECWYKNYRGFIHKAYLADSPEKKPATAYGNNYGGRKYADPKDLSAYKWHTVRTNGRGRLVFQKTPGGKFISSIYFQDGDSIYVNERYRENYGNIRYTMAYCDGVFGYVDAGYIRW